MVQNNGNTKIYTCESVTRAKYKLLGVNKKQDTIKIGLDRLYNMYIKHIKIYKIYTVRTYGNT